jgi:hypothetical protein
MTAWRNDDYCPFFLSMMDAEISRGECLPAKELFHYELSKLQRTTLGTRIFLQSVRRTGAMHELSRTS